MIKEFQKVAIINVETIQDPKTGDRVKAITSGHIGMYKVDLVGIQTQQVLQSQNIVLSYSVILPRRVYNNEKYCYFDNQLFEIVIVSKARDETYMNLNVKKIEDKKLEAIIKEWVDSRYGI